MLTGAISIKVIPDILTTPRTNLGPQGIVIAICLFMVFAPALQVKGTGKGYKIVRPRLSLCALLLHNSSKLFQLTNQ